MGIKNEMDFLYRGHLNFSYYSQLIMLFNLREWWLEEKGSIYQLFIMFKKVIEKQYIAYSLGMNE